MGQFDWIYAAASFGGGVLGASIGALPSFILCGLALILGSIVTMITGDVSFNQVVTWGPVLGPHTAFAGGVAAAAFAAKTGRLSSGRDILSPLIGKKAPSVILIGGVFGVVGSLLVFLLSLIPDLRGIPWINVIALSIALNTLLVRFLFGGTGLFGRVETGKNRWRPSEDTAPSPWHLSPLHLILLAVAAGFPAACLSILWPGVSGILFGAAAVSLVFLLFGGKVPVFFHIVLASGFVAEATGDVWWGMMFGFLAAFLADLSACLFLLHGDTHIDPPAVALSLIFSLHTAFVFLGIYNITGYGRVLIAAGSLFVVFLLLTAMRRVSVVDSG